MDDLTGLKLSSYYLNTRRLAEMTGVDIPVVAQRTLNENSGERAQAMRFASRVANEMLKSGAIPNLTRIFAAEGAEETAVIASLWGVFTFGGVSQALMREQEGKSRKPATFSATIPLGDAEYALSGELSNDHMFSDTTATHLRNRRRVLMAGRFELRDSQIEVQPYIIGDMIEDMGSSFPISWGQRVRVYPEIMDTFEKISEVKTSKEAELEALLTIPEDEIKHAFAAIIGEPFVPKDWGGEKSDLQTSRVHIEGKPVSAAFIFKGPSISGEMHPANMGKRGDQVVRAFDEPVDLVVVQHCNKIANTVVRLAEALAVDAARPRRYCIIDGEDTVRILKAYGMFPPPKAPKVS